MSDNVVSITKHTHYVHLDASQLVSKGIRATCSCGEVGEALKDAQDVLGFLQNHCGRYL